MTCPSCGATDQAGKFCSQCGTELGKGCPACGGKLTPGARYCPHCGEEVGSGGEAGAGAGARRARPPWWLAVAAAIVVVLILLIPERAERAGPLPARQPLDEMGAPGAMGAPGGFTGDMRTDADRLFNRVMEAAEAGREAEVAQFMPMAQQAYQMVPNLDHDGLFHLAILYETAGDYAAARATAEQILRDSPDHILGLGVAGTASASAGDEAAAADYFQRLLDGYDRESARLVPEYVDHQAMVDEYRRVARTFLEQR
jgi:tetratricopeptide (TPR) repeat protein